MQQRFFRHVECDEFLLIEGFEALGFRQRNAQLRSTTSGEVIEAEVLADTRHRLLYCFDALSR